LFVPIYFSIVQKSNDFFFITLPLFLSPPSTIKQTITMFLPPTSSFTPIVYPMSNKPYPPAILVKHSTWFLKNADLFICHGQELYGIHLSLFNKSPLFREIILYGKTNEIGTNPYRPILFDTLAKEVFNNFLYLIYYGAEHLEYLSPGEWFKIKRLCTDWCFPRLTATIVRQLIIFRRRSLPPPLQMMASNLPVYRVFDEQERLSRRICGRTILVEESSDEEETIVEDNDA
jgi:hypothetical protein